MIDHKSIILFDGVCTLCSFSVQFIAKRDMKGYFYFASIESEIGEKLVAKYELKDIDSLILIQNNKAYIYSDAVLEIIHALDSWHRYLYVFRYLPKYFRDIFYKFIAKYRYKIFGKKESCLIPNKKLLKQFL